MMVKMRLISPILTILIHITSITANPYSTSVKRTTMETALHPSVNKDTNSCTDLNGLLGELNAKYQHQPTFLQAVEEMALSLSDIFEDSHDGDFYRRAFLAMTEPERVISFRIPWMDDQGVMRFNRGWRVEFSR